MGGTPLLDEPPSGTFYSLSGCLAPSPLLSIWKRRLLKDGNTEISRSINPSINQEIPFKRRFFFFFLNQEAIVTQTLRDNRCRVPLLTRGCIVTQYGTLMRGQNWGHGRTEQEQHPGKAHGVMACARVLFPSMWGARLPLALSGTVWLSLPHFGTS